MTNKLFILYFHKNGARICGNYYGGIMYKDIFINLFSTTSDLVAIEFES